MSDIQLKHILQAALFAAGEPLTLERMVALFGEEAPPDRATLLAALAEVEQDCQGGPLELQRIENAYRLQTRREFAPWLNRLFAERPARYSRAVLETLAIIAYRQPVTRGEIEAIRGVAVSSEIIRALTQREWIRQVGAKEVPGRPALYGTTRAFLEHFNLKSLEELPPLAEVHAEANAGLSDSELPEEAEGTEGPPAAAGPDTP